MAVRNIHKLAIIGVCLGATVSLLTSCADLASLEQTSEPAKTQTSQQWPASATPQAPVTEDSQIEEIIVSSRQAKHRNRSLDRNDRHKKRRAESSSTTQALASIQPDEEVWIISKSAATAESDSASPGTGSLMANVGEAGSVRQISLPLKHTSVNALVNGYIGTVDVVQQFENPYSEKIEAIYVFPLPEKAAVSEFVMTIGERRIRGILREKTEAEEIYRHARDQGYRASLLTQHRPNIFRQKVANIESGASIDIEIKYFHTLRYDDGWYTFVFPTVVGPRYNPPGAADGIAAKQSGSRPSGKQPVTVSYLRPNERSAHDIDIDVTVNAGIAIEELQASHPITATQSSPDVARVELSAQGMIPNKDFVLRFRVAGDTLKSGLLSWVDPQTQQGYFTMMLYPPNRLEVMQRSPMELVFVLDCSGSMDGVPLAQAKQAVLAALDDLRPEDTFQIIRFSDVASQFGNRPIPATHRNIAEARKHISRLRGTGGTRMIEGIKAALDFPQDAERLRFVSFMTDGFIGNEADILRAVNERIGAARVFSFGVGSSVNRYLLERMAQAGRGAVAYLGPNDSGANVMHRFFERITRPVLTDIEFDWGGMLVSDVYPSTTPDLFVGRPVFLTGKFLGAAGDVFVSGRTAGKTHTLSVSGDDDDQSNESLAKTWARRKIAELVNRQSWEGDPHAGLQGEILVTALEYGLMSAYTAFVAVDASQVTEGEYGVTVQQAVPVPEGVRYETTVNDHGTR